MLLDKVKEDLKQAMLARDELKVSTLRLLLAQIQNHQIASGTEVTDEDVVGAIQRQVKERKESIEAFRKGNREELAQKEEKEWVILNQYLPEQLTDEQLEEVIEETVSQLGAVGPSDFGKVMGAVMGKVKGKTDGNKVSRLVKEKLG